MTHFLKCANEGISASKCADNEFQSSGDDISSGFDFGTNTGLALDLREILSPEELAKKYPQIDRTVFPTDKNGNIIAYRPQEASLFRVEATKEFNEINPVSVNEREEFNWTQEVPVIVEQGLTEEQVVKTLNVIDELKKRLSGASTNEKLAGAGVGLGILRFVL